MNQRRNQPLYAETIIEYVRQVPLGGIRQLGLGAVLRRGIRTTED